MKCDPCVGNPPTEQDLVQSGVWWLGNKDWNDYSDLDNEEIDNGSKNVHFTRLHFRYNRKSFAQDLQFQVTPNTENYQARYIITHPASGDFNCICRSKIFEGPETKKKKGTDGANCFNRYKSSTTGRMKPRQKMMRKQMLSAQYATLLPQVKDEMENKDCYTCRYSFIWRGHVRWCRINEMERNYLNPAAL